MSKISGNYDSNYLNEINNTLKRIDSKENGGNGDGKVTVAEAYKELGISGMLSGQSQADAAKIKAASSNLMGVMAKYAGDDGVFNAQEYAEFINGSEWKAVLDVWHSSSKKAEMEMSWIDDVHINDGQVTKGEIKSGLFNNLRQNNVNMNFSFLENLIDMFAGKDGVFTTEEYMQMKKNPMYKMMTEQYNAVPWFNYEM